MTDLSLPKDRIRVLLLEGVNPSAVELMRSAGYTNLTVEQLQRLGAAGLPGDDFVREMSKYRSR